MADDPTEATNGAPRRRGVGRVVIPRDDADRLVKALEDAERHIAERRLRGAVAVEAQELIERLGFRRFRLIEAMKGEP